MDNLISFTVSSWGITFSSSPLYINLSWGLIITATALVIARKIIKAKRG